MDHHFGSFVYCTQGTYCGIHLVIVFSNEALHTPSSQLPKSLGTPKLAFLTPLAPHTACSPRLDRWMHPLLDPYTATLALPASIGWEPVPLGRRFDGLKPMAMRTPPRTAHNPHPWPTPQTPTSLGTQPRRVGT